MAEEEKKAAGTEAFSLRWPVQLRSDLQAIADDQSRSLSKQVIFALKKFVAENKKAQD
ncbi:hypothetical protein JZU61_06530 [bacterium]|nr:hypothetical protein [bacterium]